MPGFERVIHFLLSSPDTCSARTEDADYYIEPIYFIQYRPNGLYNVKESHHTLLSRKSIWMMRAVSRPMKGLVANHWQRPLLVLSSEGCDNATSSFFLGFRGDVSVACPHIEWASGHTWFNSLLTAWTNKLRLVRISLSVSSVLGLTELEGKLRGKKLDNLSVDFMFSSDLKHSLQALAALRPLALCLELHIRAGGKYPFFDLSGGFHIDKLSARQAASLALIRRLEYHSAGSIYDLDAMNPWYHDHISALVEFTALTSLNLSKNCLGVLGSTALGGSLTALTALNSLDLRYISFPLLSVCLIVIHFHACTPQTNKQTTLQCNRYDLRLQV